MAAQTLDPKPRAARRARNLRVMVAAGNSLEVCPGTLRGYSLEEAPLVREAMEGVPSREGRERDERGVQGRDVEAN